MKLIKGTEVIDNSFIERGADLADRIYFEVIDQLSLEEQCLDVDEDGESCNTEYGTNLYNRIEATIIQFLEEESDNV
jgi:hypothetical protein